MKYHVNFEVGDIVKYGDEDFIINGKIGDNIKVANVSHETFWIPQADLVPYNIPIRDEDMTGATEGDR